MAQFGSSYSDDQPLVTIVIATYNDFEHLQQAIRLARAQTWTNVEIIVVDDCSTEPVEPKLSDVVGEDPRVRVVRRASNGGVFEALLTGLSHARGEFIYLGSTNDPIEPRFVAANVGCMQRHPSAGMGFSDPGIIVGWQGHRREFPLCIAPKPIGLSPDEVADRMRATPFHISSNTVLFRTDALRRIGGCRSAMGLYADWFACVITALREGAVYLPEVLAFSRAHPGAYSERRRWTHRARAGFAAITMRTIISELSDVVPRLRRSTAVSSFGFPVLISLLRDADCRPLISVGALNSALLRDGWGFVRAVLPDGARRRVRRAITSTPA